MDFSSEDHLKLRSQSHPPRSHYQGLASTSCRRNLENRIWGRAWAAGSKQRVMRNKRQATRREVPRQRKSKGDKLGRHQARFARALAQQHSRFKKTSAVLQTAKNAVLTARSRAKTERVENLDIAEEAVESFSLTHGFHPAGQIGCQEILTRPTACVADASQGLFWMAASSLGCNTATASWPCQSFSAAGGRQGWAAPGGQSFRDMLDFCRLSGIRFLLLENVPEVWNDLNLRATLIAAIHEAGFRFLFAEILRSRTSGFWPPRSSWTLRW